MKKKIVFFNYRFYIWGIIFLMVTFFMPPQVCQATATELQSVTQAVDNSGFFNNLYYVLIPGIIVLISSFIELYVQSRQLKSLREDLEGTKAIIKTTADLRNALLHDLEGSWKLVGDFSKFQGDASKAYKSTGVLILSWNLTQNHYDAIYCYSVIGEFETVPVVTAICSGYSDSDIENKDKSKIELSMKIDTRTSQNSSVTYHDTFKLVLTAQKRKNELKITRLSSVFSTPTTTGKLSFTKQ